MTTSQEKEKVTEEEKMVFAEVDITVHRVIGPAVTVGKEKRWNVESVTLVPGETFPFEQLPPYQQNAVLNDKVEGLKLLTTDEVKARLEERDRVLGLAENLQVRM